jgi:ADP-ribosylglycohydrolase
MADAAAVQMANRHLSKELRLRNALWGFFAGDALAMPTHWYYGGLPQIQRDYGKAGVTGYTKPVTNLPGSILNKSNINGGGRGSFTKTKEGISIIGDVINHGKRELWDPSEQIHYHATLQRGENTLEAQLARVLMRSIVARGGTFDPDHFREAYMNFMTTAGSHNDTYASDVSSHVLCQFDIEEISSISMSRQ